MTKKELHWLRLWVIEAWDDYYQEYGDIGGDVFKNFLIARLDKHINNDKFSVVNEKLEIRLNGELKEIKMKKTNVTLK